MVSKIAAESTWRRITLMPLERFETLEVLMPDDSVQQAVWTGARWLSAGKTVLPKAWRVPEFDQGVPENIKLQAREVLKSLPDKLPLKQRNFSTPFFEPRRGWIKRATDSVRNHRG